MLWVSYFKLNNTLELDTLLWFENNYMIPINTQEHLWAKVGNKMIWESSKEKILEINLDNNLSFQDFDLTLYKRAGNKLTHYTWYI